MNIYAKYLILIQSQGGLLMLNNVCIMGRLTSDPEVKYTQNSIPVTSFAIAVDRDYKDSSDNYPTDFIDIVAWRNTAEFAAKYFSKGEMISITGRLQTRTYQDKQGNNRKVTEIIANNIYFCGSKKEQIPQKTEIENFEPIDIDVEDLPF